MEENVFDEELADKIQYHEKLATGKCIVCKTEVTGKKMYCEECYKKHKSITTSQNYQKYKKNRKQKFDVFAEFARKLLQDVDLTKYGVKKK